MKKICRGLLPALVVALMLLALETVSASSIVRGRLVRVTPQGKFPAGGIPVSLNNARIGRSNRVYSGPDGMYYLYNIPAGAYTIEVWTSNSPMVFQIQVSEQAYSDVGEIRVP